jgi:hypothetical protein
MGTDLQSWRDQVAAAVRDVKVMFPGGTCWVRSALGGCALTYLGLRPRHVMGAMLFRAGPDEKLDTVAFCGPGNAAHIDYPGAFHCWLEADGHLIDFACGDWQEDAPIIEQVSVALGAQEAGLPPINFHVSPPEYIWRPREELTSPWRSTGTPALGESWYRAGVGARKDQAAEVQAIYDQAAKETEPIVRDLWPRVKAMLPPPLPAQPRQPTRAEARRMRQMHRHHQPTTPATPSTAA